MRKRIVPPVNRPSLMSRGNESGTMEAVNGMMCVRLEWVGQESGWLLIVGDVTTVQHTGCFQASTLLELIATGCTLISTCLSQPFYCALFLTVP